MKKIIMFMLLVLSIGINAQKYVPFPTENAQWSIHYKNWSSDSGLQSFIEAYIQQGDTTINNLSYKKIYLQTHNGTELTTRFIGGIREENKCIYWLDYYYRGNLNGVRSLTNEQRNCIKQQIKSTAGEVILYNFNTKNIGDTLYSIGYHSGKIMAIDSVLIQNTYRKRYAVQSYTQTISQYSYNYIIEGIGSVREGLLSVVIPILACSEPPLWEFVCFSQNGESIYKNPDYVDCNSTVLVDIKSYFGNNSCWSYKAIVYYPMYGDYLKMTTSSSESLAGDTIINSINYKKFIGNEGMVAIRQAGQKIYAKTLNQDNEFLLYDFSVGVGDVIISDSHQGYISRKPIVTAVDSVIMYNGEKRKRISVEGDVWIEGIGSINGFMHPQREYVTCDCNNSYSLISFAKENHIKFYNSSLAASYSICGGVFDGVEKISVNKNSVTVSPNPVTTTSTLKWSGADTFSTLTITDLMGKTIQTVDVRGKSEITINRSDFNKGLYIVRLYSKSGQPACLKLITE